MKAAVLHTMSYKFTSSMIIVQLLGTNQKIPAFKHITVSVFNPHHTFLFDEHKCLSRGNRVTWSSW